jgi:hypothetical protein
MMEGNKLDCQPGSIIEASNYVPIPSQIDEGIEQRLTSMYVHYAISEVTSRYQR